MTERAAVAAADYADLDRRLLEIVRPIRILPAVAWSAPQAQRWLQACRRGGPHMPQPAYARPELSATRHQLQRWQRALPAPGHDAIGDYLHASAQSWDRAAQMLEQVGTAGLGTLSSELYGRPQDRVPASRYSHLDAARYFVALADDLGAGLQDDDARHQLSSAEVRQALQQEVDAWFGQGCIQIDIDPLLTAKAAAGAQRIRLREGDYFSRYDLRQLLQHEAFVHSLTALNGARQPVLASLARTSPRATLSQEGLAVFAELMAGALDIARLKRISLRIIAIDMAQRGADFVEVYRFFQQAGQSVEDSFHSTRRVFRGVPVSGGSAFAKDNVYLAGLFAVHTFFRLALKQGQLQPLHHVFAGKFCLQDLPGLACHFEQGTLLGPRWLPPWMTQVHGLAAKLAFSVFINGIRLPPLEA